MEVDLKTHLDMKEIRRSIKGDDDHQQEKAGTLDNSLNLMKEALDLARRNPYLQRKKERETEMGGKWEN